MAPSVSTLVNQIVESSKLLTDPTNDDYSVARDSIIAAATKLVRKLETPSQIMVRITWHEPSRTAALRVAFEAGLLKKLDESEPQSSAQLAGQIQADPALVARVMKHLAADEMVREVGKDQYCASPFTIASNSPAISGGLVHGFEGMKPVFNILPKYLADTRYQNPNDSGNGPAQMAHKIDQPYFSMFKDNPRLGKAFNDFMAGYTRSRPQWIQLYPCESRLLQGSEADNHPLLVDVGGGIGQDISAFAEKFPGKGVLILQDTPQVIETAQRATPSLPAAIKPVAHDFFTPQPVEYHHARAYFMHYILHDWPDKDCRTILSHLRDAMKPGYSKILIHDYVVSDVGAPMAQTSLDWTMMAVLASCERTESQWRELLASAGLKVNGIWQNNPDHESVIEAVRADD